MSSKETLHSFYYKLYAPHYLRKKECKVDFSLQVGPSCSTWHAWLEMQLPAGSNSVTKETLKSLLQAILWWKLIECQNSMI